MLSAGSGITPVMAMLRALVAAATPLDVAFARRARVPRTRSSRPSSPRPRGDRSAASTLHHHVTAARRPLRRGRRSRALRARPRRARSPCSADRRAFMTRVRPTTTRRSRARICSRNRSARRCPRPRRRRRPSEIALRALGTTCSPPTSRRRCSSPPSGRAAAPLRLPDGHLPHVQLREARAARSRTSCTGEVSSEPGEAHPALHQPRRAPISPSSSEPTATNGGRTMTAHADEQIEAFGAELDAHPERGRRRSRRARTPPTSAASSASHAAAPSPAGASLMFGVDPISWTLGVGRARDRQDPREHGDRPQRACTASTTG